MKYVQLDDTIHFWFGSNNTAGSGDDGASAVFDVREGGAAASAAPVLSGSATLLTHANYPAGAYEVEIAVTAANGFAVNKNYGVFATLAVDSQNPTGFIGEFRTAPVQSKLSDSLTPIDGKSYDAALKIIAAAVAGITSGAGTGTELFKGLDKTTTRVQGTIVNGNRADIDYL